MKVIINETSEWAKCTMFRKRLVGAYCYFIFMFIALWHPIVADVIFFKALSKQFIIDKDGF